MRRLFLLALSCLLLISAVSAQVNPDTISSKALKLTQRYISNVKSQAAALENKIDKQTVKCLCRLQKIEARIAGKLAKLNSVAGDNFLTSSASKYNQFREGLRGSTLSSSIPGGEYLPYVDSMKGSLSFLQNGNLTGNFLQGQDIGKLGSAVTGLEKLQGEMQKAEIVKRFIAERKQQIKDALSHFSNIPNGLSASFSSYNKQAYYYAAQIRDYREMLNDPDKLERKTLTLLNQLPAFQAFMKEHSELAGLFSVPGNYGDAQGLIGLQTRDQVQQLITSQMGGAANAGQMFGQQIQTAKQGLDQFKEKLGRLGGGSGDIEMPKFNPNQQKTKSFLKRLEYGTNLQTQRSGYFFPTTTDIALSVGYKLSNKNIIGVGMSYKIGWGKDIQHIAITSEGLGLRSFIDLQVHKTFYASGGFEYNYQLPFSSLRHISELNDWSKSGLIGVSKIVSMKTKLFKKTKLQILWDFLSYQQRPVTQPFKFRVGYNF